MILYFTAPWCAPCKAILPKVQEAAATAGVPVRVVDINGTAEDKALAASHGVTSVPFMVYGNGDTAYPSRVPWSATRHRIELESGQE